MYIRGILLTGFLFIASQSELFAQEPDSVIMMTGVIYDELFHPVPVSHVINMTTHQGDVTDSLGIFRLPVHVNDTLLVRNIAFQDTLVPVEQILEVRIIMIRRKYYSLQEVRIFEWGSTYGDFREAFVRMPDQQTLGEALGLPTQDPDYIPYDMNEEVIKSPAFLISSPISFFYQNFSKHAKSARKVYWLQKTKEKRDLFDEIVSRENISSITGFTGDDLQEFLVFLYEKMVCDYKCSELQIYTEIHKLWDVYQELR